MSIELQNCRHFKILVLDSIWKGGGGYGEEHYLKPRICLFNFTSSSKIEPTMLEGVKSKNQKLNNIYPKYIIIIVPMFINMFNYFLYKYLGKSCSNYHFPRIMFSQLLLGR